MKHITARDLPVSEKPIERILSFGPETLTDAELLAVVLRTGTRNCTVIELARSLLSKRQENLLNLYEYSIEELTSFEGIGRVKAAEIKAIAELSRRISMAQRKDSIRLNDAESVAFYFMEKMRHLSEENVVVAAFDNKGKLIKDYLVSIGTVSSAVVSAREIFIKALMCQAVHIILLHNHPSGQCIPSLEDDRLTEKIYECGKLLDISLTDHIIIGDNVFYSYALNHRLLA